MEQKEDTFEPTRRERYGGWIVKTTLSLSLWYVFSGLTLFSNKVILTDTEIAPVVFGAYQIVCTAVLGGLRIHGIKSFKKWASRSVSDD